MEWSVLAVLITIGLVLLILEFLVVPGTTVVGVIGFACVCFGVYLGYRNFGTPVGHYILATTVVLGFFVTFYSLRAKTWKRLSLSAEIDGAVEGVSDSIRPGDTGKCVGRLAPMGKVMVGEHVVEAQSQSGYIDADSEVEVVKVFKDKIIVKLKS